MFEKKVDLVLTPASLVSHDRVGAEGMLTVRI